MTPRILIALPLTLLPLVAVANGEGVEPAAPDALLALAGDAEYGAFLAQECAVCHRPTTDPAGATTEAIPVIAGRPAADLVQALFAYRAGHRANPVMQTIARSLDDEMIAALAVHFAAQTP